VIEVFLLRLLVLSLASRCDPETTPGSNVVDTRKKTWSPSFEEVEQKRAFEA
jgi:hypothetical protein